ncbi:MAG: zinc-ribbon domain-containing protein, partial [Erysipelotrichaceae bacterium]|nr:zinc-ribbon domain-containing protein [Erysipelotrichaceae bacterium]
MIDFGFQQRLPFGIEGIMYCSKCGKPINSESLFCSSCGSPVDSQKNSKQQVAATEPPKVEEKKIPPTTKGAVIISGHSAPGSTVIYWILAGVTAVLAGAFLLTSEGYGPILAIGVIILCLINIYKAMNVGEQSIEVYENSIQGIGSHITNSVEAFLKPKPTTVNI